MPDITMCDSDACPQSSKCYRYMAVPNRYRQSYAHFYRGPELKCDYFSAIRPGDIIRRHSVDRESNPSPEASPLAAKDD